MPESNPFGIPMPEPIQKLALMLQEQGNAAGLGNLLGQMATRQAYYDVLGTYPSANIMPYWYGFKNLTADGDQIPASGRQNNSIKISSEAAFICTDIRSVQTGNYRIFMRMDASDRQLMNETMHVNNVAGTAQRPGFLAKPLLLPANTTLSFDLTDLSGADNDVEFTLNGYKVYEFGG